MDWQLASRDWPNRAASRLISCRPHLWHIQDAGSGPTVLLLHGAGGATQSWRDVFPLLAETHRAVAVDLPGQGFSRIGARQRCGLTTMAEDLVRLCVAQEIAPDALVGHSAGAALALKAGEMLPKPPKAIIGINAALGTFPGLAGWLFPIAAKALAAAPLAPALLARLSGQEGRVRAALKSTGSEIGEDGVRLYTRLVQDRTHIDGTLAMMAQWSLEGLLAQLPEITTPCRFIVGENDRTVPPEISIDVAERMKAADIVRLPGLGHLAHEEAPDLVVSEIVRFLNMQS